MKGLFDKSGITPGPWIQGLFVDSKRFDFKQIGNAVPVQTARALIKEMLAA